MINDECFLRIDVMFVDCGADDNGGAFIGFIINIKEAVSERTIPDYSSIKKQVVLG